MCTISARGRLSATNNKINRHGQYFTSQLNLSSSLTHFTCTATSTARFSGCLSRRELFYQISVFVEGVCTVQRAHQISRTGFRWGSGIYSPLFLGEEFSTAPRISKSILVTGVSYRIILLEVHYLRRNMMSCQHIGLGFRVILLCTVVLVLLFL